MTEQLNNKPFLTLQHLEKVYPNGEKAVYDFNLDVNKRDFIVIVGPSGCGKSTTLRMIAGLEDITSGDIYLEDELLNYKPSNERKMAIVFQSYALYPQMTVYQNIAFPLTINSYPVPVRNKKAYDVWERLHVLNTYGAEDVVKVVASVNSAKGTEGKRADELSAALRISPDAARKLLSVCKSAEEIEEQKKLLEKQLEEIKAEAEKAGERLDDECRLLDENGNVITENRKHLPHEIRVKVFEAAEKLDIVPYLDKLPKELSGGQMQRVALGRAIIKNVPVFMMDEPLSNLDAKLRLTMRSEIVKLHNRINATTIYVTHDQTEAMTMATRIVVMSRGFIQQIGTPEEVYNDPQNIFVARFIGSPAMNIFGGEYSPSDSSLNVSGIKYDLGEDFCRKHDEFYRKKIEEFTAMLNNFDAKARESIIKILSATGEPRQDKHSSANKKGVFSNLKNWISRLKKKEETIEDFSFECGICEKKLEKLQKYLQSPHKLTVGVRSERMRIAKVKGEPQKGAFVTYPTVCELLGGEYSVHFDFCGKDMVGSYDAKDKITIEDEIAVSFDKEDMKLFDPITGDVIK